MMKWWRETKIAAALVTVVRLVLGWTWMTIGFGKLTADKWFDASGYLTNAVNNPVSDASGAIYPTYTAFIENLVLPNVKLVNIMIPIGEFLVGLGLILGALTTAAAFFGVMMNFMFLFAGTVSTNPWMVLLGMIVLVAGPNGGRFGADYFLLPMIRKGFTAVKAKFAKGDYNEDNQQVAA